MSSPRGAAYAVLGCCNYLKSFGGASAVRRHLKAQIEVVERHVASPDWPEQAGCADWPVLTQACSVAASLLDSQSLRKLSGALVTKTCETTSNGTVFLKLGANPGAEESPVTCAAFIEALGAAFQNSRNTRLLHHIRSAIDWFLGANRMGTPIYSFSTGGCYDAVTPAGLNRNQGTEASVFCLLAFLSLNKIVGIESGAH